MRLRYTLEGAAELDAVLVYIEASSLHGGRNLQRRIQAITQLLLQYPDIGKPTRDRRLRRIVAVPYPQLDLLPGDGRRDHHSWDTPQRAQSIDNAGALTASNL